MNQRSLCHLRHAHRATPYDKWMARAMLRDTESTTRLRRRDAPRGGWSAAVDKIIEQNLNAQRPAAIEEGMKEWMDLAAESLAVQREQAALLSELATRTRKLQQAQDDVFRKLSQFASKADGVSSTFESSPKNTLPNQSKPAAVSSEERQSQASSAEKAEAASIMRSTPDLVVSVFKHGKPRSVTTIPGGVLSFAGKMVLSKACGNMYANGGATARHSEACARAGYQGTNSGARIAEAWTSRCDFDRRNSSV